MNSMQFAIQTVRHDERQKVAVRLKEIGSLGAVDAPALRDFIDRHGLSSTSGISDVIEAVAAEIASWPIPDFLPEED